MEKVCSERFIYLFICHIKMSELDPSDNGESLNVLRVSMIILKKYPQCI